MLVYDRGTVKQLASTPGTRGGITKLQIPNQFGSSSQIMQMFMPPVIAMGCFDLYGLYSVSQGWTTGTRRRAHAYTGTGNGVYMAGDACHHY